MAKKSSPSADDFYDANGEVKRLSAKEMRDLADKMQGKVKKGGDIKAGLTDLFNGVKSNRAATPAPKPRKGRSMW